MSQRFRKRVLMIEDARDMQVTVKAAIGHICDLVCVSTLGDGEKELKSGDYSLLLLDVNLPDGDGFEFCRDLREKREFVDLPIMFLTGEIEIDSKVLGFELGADDYVTKPIEPTEFAARVMGKLRRSKQKVEGFTRGPYRVDMVAQRVHDVTLGKPLSLTPIEFKIFTHLLQNEGQLFSREDLLQLVWGGDVSVSRHTVDTHISSLRKKMGEAGSLLRSVFKKGYFLSFEET